MGEYKKIPVEKLEKAPWNYKQQNELMHEKLVDQIKKNGNVVNIIVRQIDGGRYEVVDGNHRLDVMKELKIKESHAWDYGEISQKQAERIAIEINETNFESDFIRLAGILVGRSETEEELAKTLPYTAQEIRDIKEILLIDWDEIKIDPDEVPEVEEKEEYMVQMFYEPQWEEKVNEFVKKMQVEIPGIRVEV